MSEQITEKTIVDSYSKEHCPNCGENFGNDKFCANCGEKNIKPEHLKISYFIRKGFTDLTDLDSKLFKTIISLLIRPGHLTKEYLVGHRKSYIAPSKLYLYISALFFLLVWTQYLNIHDFGADFLEGFLSNDGSYNDLDSKGIDKKNS